MKHLAEAATSFWERLPSFMRNQKVVRADILTSSADLIDVTDEYSGNTPWRETDIENANLITSLANDSFYGTEHRPILDIDFPAVLIPSSTPGHYHLYLDTTVDHVSYMAFLKAAAEAGIIQWGYYQGALKRGATSARLPWIKKDDVRANQLDPDKTLNEIRDKINKLREELLALESAEALEIDKQVPW